MCGGGTRELSRDCKLSVWGGGHAPRWSRPPGPVCLEQPLPPIPKTFGQLPQLGQSRPQDPTNWSDGGPRRWSLASSSGMRAPRGSVSSIDCSNTAPTVPVRLTDDPLASAGHNPPTVSVNSMSEAPSSMRYPPTSRPAPPPLLCPAAICSRGNAGQSSPCHHRPASTGPWLPHPRHPRGLNCPGTAGRGAGPPTPPD
jgi:hypothetical protein